MACCRAPAAETDDCADGGDGGGDGVGVGFVLMKNLSAMAVLSLYKISFPLALGSGSLTGKHPKTMLVL